MSYRSLLVQRCDVLRLETTDVDGVPSYNWTVLKKNEPCRIDLSYRRGGKDPMWTPEAGRAQDRTGVLFLPPASTARPGDRVKMMTGGVDGIFELDGAIDQVVNRFGRLHHLEVGVVEVAKPLGNQ